jgi:SAM-dependent methyltransferase
MLSSENSREGWRGSNRRKRAQRALERQLDYQQRKARFDRGREPEIVLAMKRKSGRVRNLLEKFQPIESNARVIEVGSGSTGLIFYFGTRYGIGVDPLAVSYASLYPKWQTNALTVAAVGEKLPFAEASFDVVLCDNVVDHAEAPETIVKELVRILKTNGLLYFTVNVHHSVYAVAAQAHATWKAVGLPFEVGPFADHTTHLTPVAAQSMFRGLPIEVLSEKLGIEEAKERARQQPPRHVGDRLKRLFYKNARFELVARKETGTPG